MFIARSSVAFAFLFCAALGARIYQEHPAFAAEAAVLPSRAEAAAEAGLVEPLRPPAASLDATPLDPAVGALLEASSSDSFLPSVGGGAPHGGAGPLQAFASDLPPPPTLGSMVHQVTRPSQGPWLQALADAGGLRHFQIPLGLLREVAGREDLFGTDRPGEAPMLLAADTAASVAPSPAPTPSQRYGAPVSARAYVYGRREGSLRQVTVTPQQVARTEEKIISKPPVVVDNTVDKYRYRVPDSVADVPTGPYSPFNPFNPWSPFKAPTSTFGAPFVVTTSPYDIRAYGLFGATINRNLPGIDRYVTKDVVDGKTVVVREAVERVKNSAYLGSRLGVLERTGASGDLPFMPLKESLPLLKDILQGVQSLNSLNIVHLDLTSVTAINIVPDAAGNGHARIGELGKSACLTKAEDKDRKLLCTAFDVASVGTATRVAPEPLAPSNHMWQVGLLFAKMCIGVYPTDEVFPQYFKEEELRNLDSDPGGRERVRAVLSKDFDLTESVTYKAFAAKLPDAAYLIKRMLDPNPETRWTAERALKETEAVMTKYNIKAPAVVAVKPPASSHAGDPARLGARERAPGR